MNKLLLIRPRSIFSIAICAAIWLSAAASIVSAQTTTPSSGSITISDRANNPSNPPPPGQSNPYPATVNVAGLTGTLSNITVTLNNVSIPRQRDIDIILQAPTGQSIYLMSDTGDLNAVAGNLTFDDAAAGLIPAAGSPSGGTFKPTDILSGVAGNDDVPAPGPSNPSKPADSGTATLNSVFGGIDPNGTWKLYGLDDTAFGGQSLISGGFSLTITTNAAAVATTTTVASSQNPSLTTQAVTFTATVASNSGTPTGTVTFSVDGAVVASNVALNGSGQATYTAPANTLNQGTRTITAVYNPTGSYSTSNGTLAQQVDSPTVISGNTFSNPGAIALIDNGASNPYPSRITVSNLIGTISKVTLTLNNLNASTLR